MNKLLAIKCPNCLEEVFMQSVESHNFYEDEDQLIDKVKTGLYCPICENLAFVGQGKIKMEEFNQ